MMDMTETEVIAASLRAHLVDEPITYNSADEVAAKIVRDLADYRGAVNAWRLLSDAADLADTTLAASLRVLCDEIASEYRWAEK